MAERNLQASAGGGASGPGADLSGAASLIVGNNEIEIDASVFARLGQSRGEMSQAVSQVADGVDSLNKAAGEWWSGASYGAASDLLTAIATGDDTSLSKFSDLLGQQSSHIHKVGELVGQAKDDMDRIVLNAYDQIGQLGVSGVSGDGGYGPRAMSVIDNARKAVDDVVVRLVGQINGFNSSAQDAGNRFKGDKNRTKSSQRGQATTNGDGQEVAIDAQGGPKAELAGDGQTVRNKDGSASNGKDGGLVPRSEHGDGGAVAAAKDKDGGLRSAATRPDGGKAQTVDDTKTDKGAAAEPDRSKTTTETEHDGTRTSAHEPSEDQRGRNGSVGARSGPGLSDGEGPRYGVPVAEHSDGGLGGGDHGSGLFGGDHGGGGLDGDRWNDKSNNGVWDERNQQNTGLPQTSTHQHGGGSVFAPTPGVSDHNTSGISSGTYTTPQSATSATATNPQSISSASAPTQPSSTGAQPPGGTQSGHPHTGMPAANKGPLGQLANAAAQAAAPVGNIAGSAAGIAGGVANLASAATPLSQPPAPPAPTHGGTGSDFRPAQGNATATHLGAGTGAVAPPPTPLSPAPPTNVQNPAPPVPPPQTGAGAAPTTPMGGAYPMTPTGGGGGQAAPTGGRHHRGLQTWRADPNDTGPKTINPLGGTHPNQDAIDAVARLLRHVLDSDWKARENYPPGVSPAYAIAAHADPDEIVRFFFTNQGRGWVPPGVVVPRAVQLGWETVPASGRGALLGRSDPGTQALRHFEAMSQEHIAAGRRYRLIAVATSVEIREELNTAILRANDNVVGDIALAPEPRYVDPASHSSTPAEDTTALLHRLQAVAPDAHRRIGALLAENADVSQLAMELAIDAVEASFAYDRPAFLDVVGALKRGEPIAEHMVDALRDDIMAAARSAEIERGQQEAKPPEDQKLVKYASDHTRISAGVALLALIEGDDDSVLDIAYEHYATNARPDKIMGFVDQLAPATAPTW